MNPADSTVIDALLQMGSGVALRVDGTQRISAIHNSALLDAWLAPGTHGACVPGAPLADAMDDLFASHQLAPLLQQLAAIAADTGCTGQDLGCMPMIAGSGATHRHLGLSVLRLTDNELLLWIRDATATQELQLTAMRSRAAAETGMALLRAPPDTVRLFLGSAMASVGALRATLRMPARTHDSLREKLTRLRAATAQLGQEAQAVDLQNIEQACHKLLEALDGLQQRVDISGNDLLPLAVLIDTVASAVGSAWRCEEQRYNAPQPVAATGAETPAPRRSRKQASWPQSSEKRWNDLLRRRGAETGTLAKLSVTGSELVPVSLRRDIDEMLLHLLRNALDHGIETPEQRLKADKSAAGQISITFEDKGPAGIRILVRDDGRGFDMQRIGKAAVMCGLISEESLVEREAGDLVGLIFKPAFTTEGLAESDGHGRGMTCLRNTVTRLNGQVSVATKSGRYTQFTLQLPVSASLQEEQASAFG